MQLDGYGDADHGLTELDLAYKHGLGVMFDTYTMNDKPWGGIVSEVDPHAIHHPASLPEFEWLYGRLGNHPALVGFMIGDDQGGVSGRSAALTEFLHERRPHLMPWLCGWIAADNLEAHNNPIVNPQIYPTLYSWGQSAEAHAQSYAATYAGWSRACREHGLYFWPMFNAAPPAENVRVSDSLLRFPAYVALAYGAEGIWYFCYSGGSLEQVGPHQTAAEARAALTPLYPVAKRVNHRIAAWGPRVMGRTCAGLFGTAFGAQAQWPFPEDLETQPSAEALAGPGEGKLVASMDEDLIVGILTKAGEPPLAMVVNCGVTKDPVDLPPRTVRLRFASAVETIGVIGRSETESVDGPEVELTLEAGGGQLLELGGSGLGRLAREKAIYAAAAFPPTPEREVTAGDLRSARAAVLRIDTFGANAEEEYQAKAIELNGRPLGRVPSGGGDAWRLRTVDLTAEQLGWLALDNEVVVRTECGDAWKFRHLALAVQLADGTWVKTNTDATVHSVADWAHSEGETWGPDGKAGPVRLRFGAG
jgi:hypothetical protein